MTEQSTTAEQIERADIAQFLRREAFLLDERRFDEWLDLLTEDIEYKVPVREQREAGTTDTPEEIYHVNDNFYRIRKRVDRLKTDFAWAEDPPSRTRHFFSNILIRDQRVSDVDVTSYLLLAVSQGANEPAFLTGRRDDTLRRENGELKLADRTVLLDQTRLPVGSISFFV